MGSVFATVGCNQPKNASASLSSELENAQSATVVTPPFEVRGDLNGLHLVYFDETGLHNATTRADVPATSREHVRVDLLTLAPELRLDPAYLYVADIRDAQADGHYEVRRMPRQLFEANVDKAMGVEAQTVQNTAAKENTDNTQATAKPDVILYGASWCGVCRTAARYFRSHQISFVEHDIEREPEARQEMLRKAQAAGVSANGVPVLDVRGVILAGFDQQRIQQILSK